MYLIAGVILLFITDVICLAIAYLLILPFDSGNVSLFYQI